LNDTKYIHVSKKKKNITFYNTLFKKHLDKKNERIYTFMESDDSFKKIN